MRKLVLFDIDGTLLRCGKAPRRAIMEAMREVYGTAGKIEAYSFSGRTDTQIIFDLIHAETGDPERTLQFMPRAIALYVQNLNLHLKSEDIAILPGVQQLLTTLKQNENVMLGLLTGNVLEGAKIKLTRAGLDHYFFNGKGVTGAFGDDSMHRSDLPAIAVNRIRTSSGVDFSGKNVVIIGDSPHDVTCGRSLNVRSIAVSTGWHDLAELGKYDPDVAVADFSNTEGVLEEILK